MTALWGHPPCTSKRESRGTQPFDSALGPSPSTLSRSPEGAALWQGSGGVPQILFLRPLPSRKGAGGMVRATIEAKPRIEEAQKAQPFGRGSRECPPALASGESRGGAPLWQEVWRMCLHKPLLFSFPLPSRKGARGMVRATSAANPRSREPRGRSPLTALWGQHTRSPEGRSWQGSGPPAHPPS